METAKKVRGTALSMPKGIALGTLISVMITALLAAVLAWLLMTDKIKKEASGYLMMGIPMLASFLGSWMSAAKIKRRWMLVCSITGGIYFLSLLAVTAICFGGNYQSVGVTGLLVLGGSLLSGMLGLTKGRDSTKSFRKCRTC